MVWGRYSGYFFWQYDGKRKVWKHGPFPDRATAEFVQAGMRVSVGKIFQEEKPVRF